MKCENGKAIFKGVAVGRIVFCESKERMVKRKRVQDTEHEIIRYLQAKKQAQQEHDLHSRAKYLDLAIA